MDSVTWPGMELPKRRTRQDRRYEAKAVRANRAWLRAAAHGPAAARLAFQELRTLLPTAGHGREGWLQAEQSQHSGWLAFIGTAVSPISTAEQCDEFSHEIYRIGSKCFWCPVELSTPWGVDWREDSAAV